MFLRRLARKLGLDRNPLRRRSDRVEAGVLGLVLAVLLVLGPFLVWRVGTASYRGAVAEAKDMRLHHRYKVDAVLLRESALHPGASEYADPLPNPVPARWLAPDGTPRTGIVAPPYPGPAGSRVPIWIDAQGTQTDPPVTPNPTGEAFAAGCAAVVGLVLGAVLVQLAVRGLVNRRRMAGWQVEWTHVEPRWSGRR